MRVLILVMVTILGFSGCDKKDSGQNGGAQRSTGSDSPYVKGACFDKVISPYVYQIAQIEGAKVFYFAMGKANKEVMSSTIGDLFEGKDPFQIVECP